MRRLVRMLPSLCAVIVGAASFALSYVALRDVSARLDAVPPYLAFLVPVVVDGGIIAGSAIIWESSRFTHRRHFFPYVFVGLLVIMSVTMNVAHAGPSPLAKVIASLPPLVLLGAIELVAAQHMRDAATTEAAPAEAATTEAAPAEAVRPGRPSPPPVRPEVARPQPAPAAPAPPREAPPAPSGAAVPPEEEREERRPSGSRRPVRTRAQTPATGGEEEAPLALPALPADADVPAADRVQQLFEAHLAAGGPPEHPQLANAIAAQLDVSPAYVRKLLRPLRQAQPAT